MYRVVVCAAFVAFLTTSTIPAAGGALVPALPPSGFVSDPLRSPDFGLYCHEHHGSEATVRSDLFFDQVFCDQPGADTRVNPARACSEQFGTDAVAVLVGIRAGDWKCARWADAIHDVIPVLLVPSDLAHNLAQVDAGLANVARVLSNVRRWYREQMGSKTFRLLQPLVKIARQPASEWNRLSCVTVRPQDRPAYCPTTSEPEDRYILFDTAWQEVSPWFPDVSREIIVPVFTFSGIDSERFWYGAAAAGYEHGLAWNVQAPEVASCDEDQPYCGMYALGHETGHNFGLPHTCDRSPQPPDCGRSIMQTGQPPQANLAQAEKQALAVSPWFFDQASACTPGANTLCLAQGRFQVQVEWTIGPGNAGLGKAVQLTSDTGAYWFFGPTNVELILKVLNACGFNQRFWVFSGGLTDVGVIIRVNDTVTGETHVYERPGGKPFQPILDTDAFHGCGSPSTTATVAPASAKDVAAGALLLADRFRVTATFETGQGLAGTARGVQLTSDTGYLWFFDPANVETVIKVIDACSLNNKFWVFAGGLTDVRVVLTVEDTSTGAVRTYTNPLGKQFAPIEDTSAFMTCR
jgi:hypothetical protein